jgi:uncharacterized protein YjfI (DUF2170 family)
MSWERFVLIVKHKCRDEILRKLEDYDNKKLLAEIDGKNLFVYEGRIENATDCHEALTLMVDDEEYYSISGDLTLAITFGAKIELVVGYYISLDSVEKIKDNLGFKMLSKEIIELSSADQFKQEEDDEYCYSTFSLRLDKELEEIMLNLYALAYLFVEKGIEYRMTVFNKGYPEVLGDLQDYGPWIGPSAYIVADWNDHSLIVNSSEILFDGDSVEF